MPTTSDVIAAFAYYIGNGGYYEKASAKNLSRAVSDFAANKGSANGSDIFGLTQKSA